MKKNNNTKKTPPPTTEEIQALVEQLRKAGVDAYTGDQMDEARRKRKSR
ncbi:MAG: hypothetical protein LW690_11070 [Opitutaceae bacterium]|jgi:hypothetical protein|nr:hypothetical protein [Opitutaceae bacterium]